MESLDLVSNPESTMTSASSIRELHQDLDIVQKSHDRITKLEVQLDVSFTQNSCSAVIGLCLSNCIDVNLISDGLSTVVYTYNTCEKIILIFLY